MKQGEREMDELHVRKSSSYGPLLGLLSAFIVGGCAVSNALTSMVKGGSPISLQLAERASRGDRGAQLALGNRIERGMDAGIDSNNACRIYTWSRHSFGRDRWIYNSISRSVDHYQDRSSGTLVDDELALRAAQCRLATSNTK